MENLENVNDIRLILADEIKRLRAGDSSPATVNAVVNATGKMLTTVKLEMEYMKAINKLPNIPFMDPAKVEEK